MKLKILLPYETLLRCELCTKIFMFGGRDERVIEKIVDAFHQNGERYMKYHLPN